MRCAVYARVSTDMETQKTSIAHQINFFKKYVDDKGWELYKIYQDVESGRKVENRKGLLELLEDSKENRFEVILTKSISRFARNTLEGLQIIRGLKERNIRFVTIEDGFDSESYDEFMFTLLLSIAQKESEKISERIHFGKICRARKGQYNGSNPPYGYQFDDQHEIVPAYDLSTLLVQEIYRMYLEGKGIYKIAKLFNEKGYLTPSQRAGKNNASGLWHQSTIRKILSNPIYVGDMVQNKTSTKNVLSGGRVKNSKDDLIHVKNSHTGIVTREVFEEVQKRLSRKAKARTKVQKRLFSNLLYCGICGSGLHFKKDKEIYICGKMNKMGKNMCTGVSIKEKEVKEIVIEDLRRVISENMQPQCFFEKMDGECSRKSESKMLEGIKKEKNKLSNRKEKLFELLLESIISKDEYQSRINDVMTEEALLIKKEIEIARHMSEDRDALYKDCVELLRIREVDSLLLQTLIQKIIIYHDKTIEIQYDFSI
ncbi:MAG: recombinase family protein [Bacillota bacterium]